MIVSNTQPATQYNVKHDIYIYIEEQGHGMTLNRFPVTPS